MGVGRTLRQWRQSRYFWHRFCCRVPSAVLSCAPHRRDRRVSRRQAVSTLAADDILSASLMKRECSGLGYNFSEFIGRFRVRSLVQGFWAGPACKRFRRCSPELTRLVQISSSSFSSMEKSSYTVFQPSYPQSYIQLCITY